MKEQDFTPYLRAALDGPLDGKQAEEAFSLLVTGSVDPLQMAAFLAAIQARGAHEDEIFSMASVLRLKASPFCGSDDAMDTCGTGGDGTGSFNISTAAAFVLAGCGVKVVKHGNRAQTSRSGSADVLEALGVNLNADKTAQRRCLDHAGIVFLMAPNYHPVMKAVMPVRQAMKVRTIFNLVGPLVNPAQPKYQIVGVYHRRWLEPMARVLGRLGCKRVWVVHGFDGGNNGMGDEGNNGMGNDGMDEITLGTTTVVEWDSSRSHGTLRTFAIHPTDAGLAPMPMAALAGGNPASNAALMRRLLQGDGDVSQAVRDVVMLNTAAALCVCRRAENLQQGVQMARQSLDDGKAWQALERMVAITQGKTP